MGDTTNEQTKRVCAMPYTIDNSDLRPHWQKQERSEETEVVRAFSVEHGGPAEEPFYTNPDYGKNEKAEAVAQAVRLAIMRGEIDPAVFADC